MVDLLETVGRPKTLGFQADMAHTLLYTLGYNAPEERILPEDFDWKNREVFEAGAEGADARAAPLDDRFPRRAERRHRQRLGLRTTRPAATAWSTIRTASSISSTTPATGCATTTGELDARRSTHLLGRLHVPERSDDDASRPGTTSSAR